MDSEATAETDVPRPIGATLAAARAARGLELTDIARETRVPIRHLAAIEADAHDSLPALPYAIGFVKAFARAVGVDPDLAGARFRGETDKIAHVPVAPTMTAIDERRVPSHGLVAASLAVLVLVAGAIAAWSAGAFDPAPPAPPPAAIVAAAPAAEAPVPAAATVAISPAVDGPPAVAPAAAEPLAAPVAAAPSGGVAITASQDAWFKVSVYDAATAKVVTVKTGVLAKGERYVPPPMPGLRLWTGRAGALQISVDGRVLPPLGGPVETVKNVSLDPADLRARLASAAPAGVPAAR